MAARLFEEATRVLDTDYASTTETITLSRVPDYILLDVVCPQSDFPYTMRDSMMVNGEFSYPPEHNGFSLGIRVNGNTVTISYFDRNAMYEPTVTIKAYIGQVMVDDATLFDIANAIRSKTGTNIKYLPSEMADAIYAIGGSGVSVVNDDAVIISFSIEGQNFQAEEGMTWREWVNSKYNDGVCVYNEGEDTIRFVEYSLDVLSPSNVPLKGTDTIIPDYFYYLS